MYRNPLILILASLMLLSGCANENSDKKNNLVYDSIVVSPSQPTTESNLSVDINGLQSAYGPMPEIQYSWFVNDTLVQSSDSPVLNSVNFKKGDLVKVEVKITDINIFVSEYIEVRIQNSVPQIIIGSALTYDFSDSPVSIDHISVFDTDNDDVTYNWSILSGPFNSNAFLMNANAPQPYLSNVAPGSYTLGISVSDGDVTVEDYVEVRIRTLPLLSDKQIINLSELANVNAIAIGDFNADGLNDLAAIIDQASAYSINNESALLIFEQNGVGELSNPLSYSVSLVPSQHRVKSMSVGDLNHDGLDDIAISFENGFRVFYQSSSGGFDPVSHIESLETTNPFSQLVLSDVNSDGLHDVISMFDNWSNQNIEVFHQSSISDFDVPQSYSMTHSVFDRIAIGDIDNNGLDDIVYLDGGNVVPVPRLGVLYQETKDNFSQIYDLSPNLNITTSRPVTMFDVAVGDINADGLLDIVYSYGGNRPDSSLGVIYQNPDNSLAESVRYISYDIPKEIVISDIDGDGRNDVVIKHSGWHRVGVMLQSADGILGVEHLYPSIYAGSNLPNTLVVGDINSDGKSDVVVGDGELAIFYNTLP